VIGILEVSLAHLGIFLADSFGIDKKQVAYLDKDGLFSRLSEKKLPLKLPAVTYTISDVQLMGLVNRRPNAIVASANLNFTASHTYNPFPVKCAISVGLICSKMSDYFDFIKRYVALQKSATFSVDFIADNEKVQVDLSISEMGPLSTPPSGREGRDYDRGVYYVLEGSFNINSFILFDSNNKLVRNIVCELELPGFSEILPDQTL